MKSLDKEDLRAYFGVYGSRIEVMKSSGKDYAFVEMRDISDNVLQMKLLGTNIINGEAVDVQLTKVWIHHRYRKEIVVNGHFVFPLSGDIWG